MHSLNTCMYSHQHACVFLRFWWNFRKITIGFPHILSFHDFFLYFQVKVWFQNRRTKYKRTKTEEGGSNDDPDGRLDDSKSESDISDIDDIDDVEDDYSAHAYHHVIQSCWKDSIKNISKYIKMCNFHYIIARALWVFFWTEMLSAGN